MRTLMYVQTMLFHLYCFIFIYVPPLLSFGQTCINMTKGRPYIAWWADILDEAIMDWYINISYFLLQDWPLSKFYFPFHSDYCSSFFCDEKTFCIQTCLFWKLFCFSSIRTLSSVIIKLTTENTNRERIERKLDSIRDDDNNSNYRWV
jgi:hypothetical protein